MQIMEAPNNFYLGARVDPATGQMNQDELLYYDARDLTTHAVILGMTGSGKTGLGISILEEAALDDIPMLIIDPKGDITNMLLAFPDFQAEYFKEWVNPEEAAHRDQTLEEYAETVADLWKQGLESWGIGNERVQKFRRAGRYSIYTPGSEAGLPVSILQSFAAPRESWTGREEQFREQITGTVTAILGLVGINAKPVEDPEHILLSNIFEFNWRNHRDLSMEQLILQVKQPPFTKLGVLEVDAIFDEKKRVALAQKLNNIIAAPNFQSWIKGEPLDIKNLLRTPEGYPRVTIFYVAHLNDAERQFILTLLLESVLAWMRSLSGTSSLQSILYIDEVFGMLPPYPLNPPTKDPIMRLLKQARAFGVGVILATQNPKDIDYKGLSNIGTWLIGKLQTDNDKERVLEGLDSARDASSALDIGTVEKLFSRLESRQFIYHNVHEPDTPQLIQSRWSMSYLRGPLTRTQISALMTNQRGYTPQPQAAAQPVVYQAEAGALPNQPVYSLAAPQPAASPVSHIPSTYSVEEKHPPDPGDVIPSGFSPTAPRFASRVYQYYLPVEYMPEISIRHWESITRQPVSNFEEKRRILYRPAILSQVFTRLEHKGSGTAQSFTSAFVVPNLPSVPFLNWGEYQTDPFDPNALEGQPYTAQVFYSEIPDFLVSGSGLRDLQSNMVDWIFQNVSIPVLYNPVLKMYSGLGEDSRDFIGRIQAVARQERDKEIDTVASRYEKRLAEIETRARRKSSRAEAEKEEYGSRRQEEMITGAESFAQLMRGNMGFVLSRTMRMRRYAEQSRDNVAIHEQDLEQILAEFERTEREMETMLQGIQEKWVNIVNQNEEVKVSPYKKDINVMLFGICWVPYWSATVNGMPTSLPASSSGLSYSQDPMLMVGYGGGYRSY